MKDLILKQIEYPDGTVVNFYKGYPETIPGPLFCRLRGVERCTTIRTPKELIANMKPWSQQIKYYLEKLIQLLKRQDL